MNQVHWIDWIDQIHRISWNDPTRPTDWIYLTKQTNLIDQIHQIDPAYWINQTQLMDLINWLNQMDLIDLTDLINLINLSHYCCICHRPLCCCLHSQQSHWRNQPCHWTRQLQRRQHVENVDPNAGLLLLCMLQFSTMIGSEAEKVAVAITSAAIAAGTYAGTGCWWSLSQQRLFLPLQGR